MQLPAESVTAPRPGTAGRPGTSPGFLCAAASPCSAPSPFGISSSDCLCNDLSSSSEREGTPRHHTPNCICIDPGVTGCLIPIYICIDIQTVAILILY